MTHSFPTRRSSDLSHSINNIRVCSPDARNHAKSCPCSYSFTFTFTFTFTRKRFNRGADDDCFFSDGVAIALVSAVATLTAEVGVLRSEEHTSELQSLMRHSYAFFFLKNKKI